MIECKSCGVKRFEWPTMTRKAIVSRQDIYHLLWGEQPHNSTRNILLKNFTIMFSYVSCSCGVCVMSYPQIRQNWQESVILEQGQRPLPQELAMGKWSCRVALGSVRFAVQYFSPQPGGLVYSNSLKHALSYNKSLQSPLWIFCPWFPCILADDHIADC